MLEDLEGAVAEPPEGAERVTGVFSLVGDAAAKRVRKIPTLYHGTASIFADKDLELVKKRLRRTIKTVLASDHTPAYLVNAVRFDDKFGLYARDVFNRSGFRRRLTRLGVEFAEDPYVRLTEGGTFECDDWGEFIADFIVIGGGDYTDAKNVVVQTGAWSPFMFGVLRVGNVRLDEFKTLVRIFRSTHVVATRDPEALMSSLREHSSS